MILCIKERDNGYFQQERDCDVYLIMLNLAYCVIVYFVIVFCHCVLSLVDVTDLIVILRYCKTIDASLVFEWCLVSVCVRMGAIIKYQ